MRLNERLNLVLQVERDGTTVYVHSTPISREVFERFYLPIAKTLAKVGTNDLGMVSGPRVAALILKDAAKECGMWEGEQGVERGLLPEIRRLTNVVLFGPDGWRPFPFDKAISEKFFDEDDQAEVESAIVFFTVASLMGKKKEKPILLAGFASLWGAETTSLNCTEYGASLPTLTATENTGVKATQSVIPS